MFIFFFQESALRRSPWSNSVYLQHSKNHVENHTGSGQKLLAWKSVDIPHCYWSFWWCYFGSYFAKLSGWTMDGARNYVCVLRGWHFPSDVEISHPALDCCVHRYCDWWIRFDSFWENWSQGYSVLSVHNYICCRIRHDPSHCCSPGTRRCV